MSQAVFRGISRLAQVSGRSARSCKVAEIGPKFSICAALRCKWSNDALTETVNNDKVVIFMKGTPDEPMCGFSRAVVKIMEMHGVENYTAYNILEDQELRSRIKEFSSWPTVPQVYMNGEFLGGCDIMIQMHQNGELIEELQKIGHISALADADVTEK